MGIKQNFANQRGLQPISPVARFDVGTVLSKLEAAGLLGTGRVHILSFDAIRLAFGDRWPDRKALVWDMAENTILKRVSEHDFTTRLSDCDFLLITPRMDKLAAQMLAARICREILTHFLGEAQFSAISIKMVTSFANQELTCQPLTEEELRNQSAPPQQTETEPRAPKGTSEAIDKDKMSSTIAMVDNRSLRFSNSVDPIIDLSRWAVAGHRIDPVVTYQGHRTSLSSTERRRLLPRDLQAIDIATLRRGIERLKMDEGSTAKKTVLMTVSFFTLSNTNTRTALLAQAGQAKAAMSASVIWEITDFDVGVPVGRLQECIGALTPYSRAVFVRAEPATLMAISEKSFGRHGLIFQSPHNLTDEEEASAWLTEMNRVASKRSTTLIAANLPSVKLLPLASLLGFTHATVRTAQ